MGNSEKLVGQSKTKDLESMEKSLTISNWLRSGEYYTQIDSVYTKIIRNCESSRNESQTASVFETEIYFLVRNQLGIELSFSKEENVDGIVHEFAGLTSRQSGHGRLDAVVNDIVIEYKHHTKLVTLKQKESAFEQVKDYLIALDKNESRKCDAILTDGRNIAYFQSVGGVINHSSLRSIEVDDIDRIIKAILSNQSKKFEPSNIVRDFSISPNSYSESKVIATILYNQLTNGITEKSHMLYSEWKELMHLSVDDNGKSNDIAKRRRDLSDIFEREISDSETEYKALFALQMLVLYELGKPEKLNAYKITGFHEISKEELIKLGYPNKKPRKSYMAFDIEPLEKDLTFLVEHHLIERLIELNANHAKGTPVFIEP